MKLVIASAVAAALALAMTPALAKSKKQSRHHDNHHTQQHRGQQYHGSGWNTRNVSDPSFGSRAGIDNARRSGRCVSDLGYGRYEYCGW